MNERLPKAPDITCDIFNSHFKSLLSEEDFQRARAIFENIQFENARGIAIQLHIATEVGMLGEVLSVYERLIAPDSFLSHVRDPIRRAVEVREFKDVVYASVLTEPGSGPTGLLSLMDRVQVPKIFDLMSS